MRRAAVVAGSLAFLLAGSAQAQTLFPFTGFAALPSFAWPRPAATPDADAWDGTYARMSTGFEVSSSRRFGTFAGPTVGFEGGKFWRDGPFIYGIVGAFDYVQPIGGYGSPRFGSALLTRDFAGAVQFKAGAFVADNVLVYTKVGGIAVNETLRVGATPFAMPFDRTEIAVRPDARVGVEWAVTERLTLGLEAGVRGSAIR
jgi:outer membrane immunogenic protein